MNMVKYIYYYDKMNADNRTLRNCDRRFVNCGGYALQTMNWYCPYDFKTCAMDEDNDAFLAGDTQEEQISNAVNFITNDLPFVRSISSPKDYLTEYEYVVAFRVREDLHDFHFFRQEENGEWTCKWGNTDDIDVLDNIYPTWDGCYDSKIAFLAVLKPQYRIVEKIRDEDGEQCQLTPFEMFLLCMDDREENEEA